MRDQSRHIIGKVEKYVVEINSEPVGWLCPLVCGNVVAADRQIYEGGMHMAYIEKRKNKKGELTAYRFRVYNGYDVNGKQMVQFKT